MLSSRVLSFKVVLVKLLRRGTTVHHRTQDVLRITLLGVAPEVCWPGPNAASSGKAHRKWMQLACRPKEGIGFAKNSRTA
jgi:hypothetical protein